MGLGSQRLPNASPGVTNIITYESLFTIGGFPDGYGYGYGGENETLVNALKIGAVPPS